LGQWNDVLDWQAGRHVLTIRLSLQRGVTLIELMIAITVLAILMVLALPGLQTWMLNARIRTASEDMLAGVQLARAEAVRRNARIDFVLDAAGAGWGVGSVAGGCPVTPANCIQYRPQNYGSLGVVVTPTPAGSTKVTFDGLGRPSGAGNFTQVNIDLTPTVLSAAQTRDLEITVGVGGEVRMCDPNVGTGDPRHC
jgi:type IV fimbrial biogenesis protein FimT